MPTVSKQYYHIFCMRYRKLLELITQIIILILFVIIIPVISVNSVNFEVNDHLRILDDNGDGMIYFMFKRVKRNSPAFIVIYLVGLFIHIYLEFSGTFFKFLFNYFSRHEFNNLYFNLITNNSIRIYFIDKTKFICSELRYNMCKDISKNFLEELPNITKTCLLQIELNVHMDEDDYGYFNSCLDKIRITNISAKPDVVLDNHREYIMIGKDDRDLKVFYLIIFSFFTIIGLGEIYKQIFLCYTSQKIISIDKEVSGLNIKIDSFIRNRHPSLVSSRGFPLNENAPDLNEGELLTIKEKNVEDEKKPVFEKKRNNHDFDEVRQFEGNDIIQVI